MSPKQTSHAVATWLLVLYLMVFAMVIVGGATRLTGSGLSAKSLSGDLKVGIPPRRRIDFDVQSLSGEMRTDLPPGDGSPPEKQVTLRVKSVSGNVTLVGA